MSETDSDIEKMYIVLSRALHTFNNLGMRALMEAFSPNGILFEDGQTAGDMFAKIDEDIELMETLIKATKAKHPIVADHLSKDYVAQIDTYVVAANRNIQMLIEKNKWIDEDGQKYKRKYAELMDLVKSFYNLLVSGFGEETEKIIPKTKNVLGVLLYPKAKADSDTKGALLTPEQWHKGFMPPNPTTSEKIGKALNEMIIDKPD